MSARRKKATTLSRRAFLRRIAGEGFITDAPDAGAEFVSERPDEIAALAYIRDRGVSVSRIGGDSKKLRVRASGSEKGATDEWMTHLEAIADQIVWLDLGNTSVGDSGLSVVAHMKGLRRLYLQNTQVTDVGLACLADLEDLHYLNLYGTAISDVGLRNLRGLKSLRRLFLWQTGVTPTAVRELVASLPEIEVSMGTG